MIMLPSPSISIILLDVLFYIVFYTPLLSRHWSKERERSVCSQRLPYQFTMYDHISFRKPSTGAAISTDSLSQHFPWVKIFLEPQLFPAKRIIFRRNNRESQNMVSPPNANEQMILSQNAKIALGAFLSVARYTRERVDLVWEITR